MRLLPAAGLCLSLVGCSSIVDIANGDDGQRIFGGTRRNAAFVDGSNVITHGGVIEKVYGVCDFPLSLALDTAFLLVTVVFTIARSAHPRLDYPR